MKRIVNTIVSRSETSSESDQHDVLNQNRNGKVLVNRFRMFWGLHDIVVWVDVVSSILLGCYYWLDRWLIRFIVVLTDRQEIVNKKKTAAAQLIEKSWRTRPLLLLFVREYDLGLLLLLQWKINHLQRQFTQTLSGVQSGICIVCKRVWLGLLFQWKRNHLQRQFAQPLSGMQSGSCIVCKRVWLRFLLQGKRKHLQQQFTQPLSGMQSAWATG